MSKTVIHTGMPQEADIARAAFRGCTVLTGADKLNLDMLVPAGTERILCFGLCGGLSQKAGVVGAINVARDLYDGKRHLSVDATWSAQIVAALHYAGQAPIVTSWFSSGAMDLADSADQRKQLFTATGCDTIDDESFYSATFCMKHGLKFALLRSVSDQWNDTLPLAATGAIMNKDGGADLNYLLRAIATEPALQTLDLFRLASDFNVSLATLKAAALAAAEVIT